MADTPKITSFPLILVTERESKWLWADANGIRACAAMTILRASDGFVRLKHDGNRYAAILARGAGNHHDQHPVVGRQRGGDRTRLPQPNAAATQARRLLGCAGCNRAAHRIDFLRDEPARESLPQRDRRGG